MTFYAGVMTGIICGIIIACVVGYFACCVLEKRGYEIVKVRGRYKWPDEK